MKHGCKVFVFALIAVLILVSYILASSDLSVVAIKNQVTPIQAKLVTTGLLIFYLSFLGSIFAILWDVLSSLVKKSK